MHSVWNVNVEKNVRLPNEKIVSWGWGPPFNPSINNLSKQTWLQDEEYLAHSNTFFSQSEI